MRLTSEYVSGDRSNVRNPDSDTESMVSSVSGYTIGGKKKRNSVKLKKFFGSMAKKTSDAAKSLAVEASKKKIPTEIAEKQLPIVFEKDVEKFGRLATEIKSSEGVPEPSRDGKGQIFKRIQAHKSGPFDFEGIKFAQELSSPHLGQALIVHVALFFIPISNPSTIYYLSVTGSFSTLHQKCQLLRFALASFVCLKIYVLAYLNFVICND